MKNFYLMRHEDVHGHSGIGVVAEGTIFDNGMVAMTWLSKWDTVTMFKNVQAVKELHGHEGRTEVIIQGRRGHVDRFEKCRELAREKKSQRCKHGVHGEDCFKCYPTRKEAA